MDNDDIIEIGSIKYHVNEFREPKTNKHKAKFLYNMSIAYRDLIPKFGDNEKLKEYTALLSNIMSRASVCYSKLPEGETENEELNNILFEKKGAEDDISDIELTEDEKRIRSDFANNGLQVAETIYIESLFGNNAAIVITKKDESYDC